MSSHHRSGGPPSLMDDVNDFDRNFHSHRFDGGRGGRGRGGGGMRGRGGPGGGDDGGGMRGRGGPGSDGGFGPRGGSRGGRGDYHQRGNFSNNNFNRPDDDQRGGPPKMPSLFDVNQPPRSFNHDNNHGGGRGRMPYPRGGGGGGRDSSVDDRYRHPGSKSGSTDGPPSLLDFPNDKPALSGNNSSNSLPSLFSVQVENSGGPSIDAEASKSLDSHKEHQHTDSPSSRSGSDHSSHRDNDSRYRERDRDSRKSSHGSFERSSSYNRDRSRSPRDRDRDRHGPPREDRSFGGDQRRGGRGGRGGGGDYFGRGGRGGGNHSDSREPHQSRFGQDNNNPPPWQDRQDGGRGGGRGNFHDRPRDMGGHHRPNEQLPPENHPFHRDRRSNFDGPPPPNRPFQEGFPPGNFDSMGPQGHNRPNFNQGPPTNRPDFFPPNNNNPGYQPHTTRSGGRPSRFSDRHDDYEDERPLTKPNLPLPNVPTTTPLYMNQPTNPTFSQARPPMPSTFSSQQPPSGLFPQGAPGHNQPPPSQFGWPNQQQMPGGSNPHINPSLLSLTGNDQQNLNMSGPPPHNAFYGGNNDYHRQQPGPAVNPYYSGVPPVSSQAGGKPPNINVQPNASLMGLQQQQQQPMAPNPAANPAGAANASSVDAWQQYYQQYWQYMQQQQQAGVQPPPTQMTAQQQFQQSQASSAVGAKASGNPSATAANPQGSATDQQSAEAWAQYWMQCQAYMQAQASAGTGAAPTGASMIGAPSQLYPQATGKQQPTVPNTASSGAPPMSSWQTFLNPKG